MLVTRAGAQARGAARCTFGTTITESLRSVCERAARSNSTRNSQATRGHRVKRTIRSSRGMCEVAPSRCTLCTGRSPHRTHTELSAQIAASKIRRPSKGSARQLGERKRRNARGTVASAHTLTSSHADRTPRILLADPRPLDHPVQRVAGRGSALSYSTDVVGISDGKPRRSPMRALPTVAR